MPMDCFSICQQQRILIMLIHQVIILRGLPGAGKTTVASTLALASRGTICSADQYMVDSNGEYHFDPKRLKDCHNLCFDKFCKELTNAVQDKHYDLRNQAYTIIVDNTNTQYWEFQKYINKVANVNLLLKELGSSDKFIVTQLIVENPSGFQSTHDVPSATIAAMKDRFEVYLGPDHQLSDCQEEQVQEHPPYEEDECVGCGNLYDVNDPHCECTDREEQAQAMMTEDMQDSIDPDYDE